MTNKEIKAKIEKAQKAIENLDGMLDWEIHEAAIDAIVANQFGAIDPSMNDRIVGVLRNGNYPLWHVIAVSLGKCVAR